MNDAVPQPEAKVRKKRARYPKHACIIRTYKFAMAVATPKQPKLFWTCDTTLDVRNRLVVLQNEEREANRLLKQQGREDEVEWLDKARMYKLVSEWSGQERLELGSAFPAGGQPVVMRGGDEGGAGESPAAEQAIPASESSVKRKSPASSLSMATPGVRKLPERQTVVHGRTGAARGKARRAGMKPAAAGDSAARAETTMRNPSTG